MNKMDDIKKITELDKKIIQNITKHTNLTSEQIKVKSLRELENINNIKAKPIKIYFKWEAGEKIGWQTSDYKFITDSEYEKRERRLNRLLEIQ